MYSFSFGKWKNLSEMLLSRAPLEAASAAEFHLCLCGQEPCIYMYIYMSMDGRKQLGYDFLCMTAEAGSQALLVYLTGLTPVAIAAG